MKRLIMLNGTMGVGKTTTCQELLKILQPSVFLDGDWCWNMNPFVVTEETKAMVLDNISYLLRNFLICSEYENVIFCWVMHDEQIMKTILERLTNIEFEVFKFTLTISEGALEKRIMKDVANNLRAIDVLERSLAKLELYGKMDTNKIDVSAIAPRQVAEIIALKLI